MARSSATRSRGSNPYHSSLSAKVRGEKALATARSGVKDSSTALYARKWKQFCLFCKDELLQERSIFIDPEGMDQPSVDIVGKVIDFSSTKLPNKAATRRGDKYSQCPYSIYKRRFKRVGEWKVLPDRKTEGSPMNAIEVSEAMNFYRREKKKIGYKRALPFRFKYMSKLNKCVVENGEESLFSVYLMAATSLCFALWLRIDELVQLTWESISIDGKNDEGLPYIMVQLKDRKCMRNQEGQKYALYRDTEESCACPYRHQQNWIKMYRTLLKRELQPNEPIFPRSDEKTEKLEFGEKMTQQTFMVTVNTVVRSCGIIPRNAAGNELGKFTAHCYRRGGAQHRFVTGKTRWPLDVVKLWGGWGTGDDVSTIIRYLFEEKSK